MSRKLMPVSISKLTLWAVGGLMIAVLSGCAGAPGMTAREVDRRHIHSTHTSWKMIQEDVDTFLMWDRPSRLSEFTIR